MHQDRQARINNYDIYAIDGDVSVDFVGRYESLADDLKIALGHIGFDTAELPRAKTTVRAATPLIGSITMRTPEISWRAGTRARSNSSIMRSEHRPHDHLASA
jgi:hypothetical protein